MAIYRNGCYRQTVAGYTRAYVIRQAVHVAMQIKEIEGGRITIL